MTKRLIVGVLACVLGLGAAVQPRGTAATRASEARPMQLGNFSVSLAVKDLAASKVFYEKLGFHALPVPGGGRFAIMQNESATIGLFQGMFEKNVLTFNPGWDRSMKTSPAFDDVREIQKKLKERGLELATAADESSTGPASVVLFDPDGNQVLLDQHVPAPKK